MRRGSVREKLAGHDSLLARRIASAPIALSGISPRTQIQVAVGLRLRSFNQLKCRRVWYTRVVARLWQMLATIRYAILASTRDLRVGFASSTRHVPCVCFEVSSSFSNVHIRQRLSCRSKPEGSRLLVRFGTMHRGVGSTLLWARLEDASLQPEKRRGQSPWSLCCRPCCLARRHC